MAFTKWLCTNNNKSQFVKIVHPGGRVELHDRALAASEIILRNPKCCVAYPHVFRQPWAIVDPEATLVLGQKYYVVPVSTVLKLRRHAGKHAPPSPDGGASAENETGSGENMDDEKSGGLCACLKDAGKRGGRREDNSGEEATERTELTRKRRKNPAKQRKSFDYWQPNLESIHEASLDDHDKLV